jgi:hypothetical protein
MSSSDPNFQRLTTLVAKEKLSREYFQILEANYCYWVEKCGFSELTRDEFLAQYIFDITTYDLNADKLFIQKICEVCQAVNTKTTYEYISSAVIVENEMNNYTWYLLLMQIPFFKERVEWGTSIRGAWWTPQRLNPYAGYIVLDSTGFWRDNKQILDPILFTIEEWGCFIDAIIEFAKPPTES